MGGGGQCPASPPPPPPQGHPPTPNHLALCPYVDPRGGSRNFQKGGGGCPIVHFCSAPSGGTSFTVKEKKWPKYGGRTPPWRPLPPGSAPRSNPPCKYYMYTGTIYWLRQLTRDLPCGTANMARQANPPVIMSPARGTRRPIRSKVSTQMA